MFALIRFLWACFIGLISLAFTVLGLIVKIIVGAGLAIALIIFLVKAVNKS
jgi:hypothetical protein